MFRLNSLEAPVVAEVVSPDRFFVKTVHNILTVFLRNVALHLPKN
ncbi:MAG: hypothetical protein JWO80_5296 [Bryobacterales bacterium]|nr:hypothetical protein [Bryobacterales bacterium]